MLATASRVQIYNTKILQIGGLCLANRKRNKEIKIRFTDDEYDVLLQRMDDADYKIRDAFIRKMVLQGYILRLDMYEVREYVRHVIKAAININQISKVANKTHSIYAHDMQVLFEQCNILKREAKKAYDVFIKAQELLG